MSTHDLRLPTRCQGFGNRSKAVLNGEYSVSGGFRVEASFALDDIPGQNHLDRSCPAVHGADRQGIGPLSCCPPPRGELLGTEACLLCVGSALTGRTSFSPPVATVRSNLNPRKQLALLRDWSLFPGEVQTRNVTQTWVHRFANPSADSGRCGIRCRSKSLCATSTLCPGSSRLGCVHCW